MCNEQSNFLILENKVIMTLSLWYNQERLCFSGLNDLQEKDDDV